MTWIRVDDGFSEHPKIVGLSDGAFRLHVRALCYCGRWSTDGVLPKGSLKFSAKRAHELVERGIWHENGHECESCPPVAPGAFYLHEFLAYNPSAEEVEEAQGRRSERARKAARARWEKTASNAPSIPSSTARSKLGDYSSTAPVPVPARISHQQPCSEPPAADDDDNCPGTAPIDPVAVKVRAVFERCTDARMAGKAIANRDAYRRTVFAEFGARERELRDVIATHPTAPVSTLAGWMLGEQNSLHAYRDLRTVAS